MEEKNKSVVRNKTEVKERGEIRKNTLKINTASL